MGGPFDPLQVRELRRQESAPSPVGAKLAGKPVAVRVNRVFNATLAILDYVHPTQ